MTAIGHQGEIPAADSGATSSASSPAPPRAPLRVNLFFKYVALVFAVVLIALLTNGAFEVWFSYQEYKESLIRIQREQAEAAAAKIGQFVHEIEAQVGWTTQLPWSASTLEQRRFDASRLLRQVPAITELSQLDATGHEQLRVSRLAMDVIGSGTDYSNDPKFTEAMAHKVYYGPVYFRRESEPYMTLALAGTIRNAGVSVAEVNLKLIWDVVSQIKVGAHGHAYVVDGQGRLIAHPDISLVLRNTDLSRLAQVQAARAHLAGKQTEQVQEADDIQTRRVLTAYAPIAPLGWIMFVELPVEEAYAPLYLTLERSGLILLAGLLLALVAGLMLARRMVVPIQALRLGAARIGSGDLGQRIAIRTGDELEGLADQFNDMAGKLQESYADLEKKVEDRTQQLAQSVAELRALGEVSQAVNSTLDLGDGARHHRQPRPRNSPAPRPARSTSMTRQQEYRLRATYGMSEDLIACHQASIRSISRMRSTQRLNSGAPVQVADLREAPPSPINDDHASRPATARGCWCRCCVPTASVGALVVRRRGAGRISARTRRPAEDVRRPIGAGDPERAAVQRDRREEPATRAREPAQVAVPRQHEPRVAHAAQRHSGLHRTHPRQHLRRDARQGARRRWNACRPTASTCSG